MAKIPRKYLVQGILLFTVVAGIFAGIVAFSVKSVSTLPWLTIFEWGLGILAVVGIGTFLFRKASSSKGSGSSIQWMQILKIAGVILVAALLAWLVYSNWNSWTVRDERKIAAAAKEAREHPLIRVDTLTLSKEWSEWIKPDSLFQPNNTHTSAELMKKTPMEIMDAEGTVFKIGQYEVRSSDRRIHQDSMRYRTPKCDSSILVLTFTPIH